VLKYFGIIIPPVIKMIRNEGYEIEIVQQCINLQKNSIQEFYKQNNIKNNIFEFDKNIIELFLSSNLAITRCGASTTAELTHTLTPFIAVPLPNSIDNHQFLNAKYYEDKGCCFILEQQNFTTENLFNLIMEFIKNKNKLETIRENMKKNYNKNVYEDIENEIKEYIQT
jgi:UDP-N-acetylglucosamine:LPS N-acetylglucosamine transferase